MKQYFVFIENKKQGPFTLSELENLDINSNSLIWKKGNEEWAKASELEELNIILENVPPPLPKKSPNEFLLYLKKNYKYIILTFIISIIISHNIERHFFDFMVRNNYGGYESNTYKYNYPQMSDEIFMLHDFLISIALFLGIFLIPILYLFKKKK